MTLDPRALLSVAFVCTVLGARAAAAEVPDDADVWRRIAGRDRRPSRDASGWNGERRDNCDNLGWYACVESCRAGSINACAELARALTVELPASDVPVPTEQLVTTAAALDKAELRFDEACRQSPSVALACEAVRRLTFARYRFACRYAAGTINDTDGSGLRDGACRGVVRLLEDSAVSSENGLLDSGLDAAREYCRSPSAASLDTCALMVSLHAREGRLTSRAVDPISQRVGTVLDLAQSVCTRMHSTSPAQRPRRAWVQLCNSLIEQRAWSAAALRSLCPPGADTAFDACAGAARTFAIDPSSDRDFPTIAGEETSTHDTQVFDGPISIVFEARVGADLAFDPRSAPWTPRATAVSLGGGGRIRWHWLELVAGADLHLHFTLGLVRAQLALDFVLQPGVVIVTTAARPAQMNRVFTASAGVVLRGGPAIGEFGSAPWIGAVGGYARAQWHSSSRSALGAGVQAELTAPTWAAGDPTFALRAIVSF